jgi:hypothetical protein
LRNKQDFEDIRARIIEKDDSVRKVLQFLRKHPVLSETVLNNSIQGAVKFVEKSVSASQK